MVAEPDLNVDSNGLNFNSLAKGDIGSVNIVGGGGERDELAAALSQGESSLRYPDNIVELDHWMAFRINEQKILQKEDFPINKDIARIFLPMPASLPTSYAQNYESADLELIGAIAAETIGRNPNGSMREQFGTGVDVFNEKGGILTASKYYAEKYLSDGGATSLAAAALSPFKFMGSAVTAAGAAAVSQAYKGALAGAGVARNPFTAALYKSPSPRSHSFSWKFVPRSISEQNAIRTIIANFKYYSSPGVNEGGAFFDYPQQFDIDFHYASHLFNIGPSVCTSVSVDYHGEGEPLYHDISNNEKAPVSVTLSLSFQETNIITKNEINSQAR